MLTGSADQPDSLLGLKVELEALANVPHEIAVVTTELERIAREIHSLRKSEAAVYADLYGSIQKFVAEHPLARKQLKIEFRVELIEEGFVDTCCRMLTSNA